MTGIKTGFRREYSGEPGKSLGSGTTILVISWSDGEYEESFVPRCRMASRHREQ